MKKSDEKALEFIVGTIVVFHGIFNAQVLQGYFDQGWLYVVSAIVFFIFVFLFRKLNPFSVKIACIVLLFVYWFLRFIYSLGIQLPGKGRDVLLPLVYSLAFGYVAATGAVACLIIYLYRFFKKKT